MFSNLEEISIGVLSRDWPIFLPIEPCLFLLSRQRQKTLCFLVALELGLIRATENSQPLVIHRTTITKFEMSTFGGIVFQALKNWF